MIYDTLDEALNSIDKLGDYSISDLLDHYDIDWVYSHDLPANISGLSIPVTRTIFINSNFEADEQVKYHELIHCLIHGSFEPFYNSSYVVSTRTEAEANLGSFYLMIKRYIGLSDDEINFSNFDITRFMKNYSVQPRFYYLIEQAAHMVFD